MACNSDLVIVKLYSTTITVAVVYGTVVAYTARDDKQI